MSIQRSFFLTVICTFPNPITNGYKTDSKLLKKPLVLLFSRGETRRTLSNIYFDETIMGELFI
jgi:hypothetical protein